MVTNIALLRARAILAPSLCAAAFLAVALFGPSTARATTGGPTFAEVLGYDAQDHKVYYAIQPGGEVDDPPQVYFIPLSGPSAGKHVRVKSYYQGDYDQQSVEVPRRIEKLRTRLKRMPTVATANRNVEGQVYGSDLPPGIKPATLARRVTKRWKDEEFFTRCRRVEVTVTHPASGATGSGALNECGPKCRVTALFAIPGRTELLAFVSTKPDTMEGGYETQVPMLLTMPSQRVTSR